MHNAEVMSHRKSIPHTSPHEQLSGVLRVTLRRLGTAQRLGGHAYGGKCECCCSDMALQIFERKVRTLRVCCVAANPQDFVLTNEIVACLGGRAES